MFEELLLDNNKLNYFYSKTAVTQLVEALRYKFAGSIPNVVNEMFHR